MDLPSPSNTRQPDENPEPSRPDSRRAPRRSAAQLSGADLLRLQLSCNSLEALIEQPSEAAISDGDAIAKFLNTELVQLLRRAEACFVAQLDHEAQGAEVKLDLLREDHNRLKRLAQIAATAVVSLLAAARLGKASEPLEADIRRYLAAQRHQLAWYRDNLG